MIKCHQCGQPLGNPGDQLRREISLPDGTSKNYTVCKACAEIIDRSHRRLRLMIGSVVFIVLLPLVVIAIQGGLPEWAVGKQKRSRIRGGDGQTSLNDQAMPEETLPALAATRRPTVASQQQGSEKIVVTLKASTLRKAPNAKAAALKSVPVGYKLRVLADAENGWLRVAGLDDGAVGFIESSQVH